MAYVVKINNIDRTNLVRARTLSIKLDADYRDVCNLMVMTSVSGFLPRVGMPLTVTDGVDPVFSGLVSSAPMTKISALNGQDTLMAVRVEAVGFYKVAARRVVGAKYADVTAGSIVADIHTEILAAEGVTVGFIGAGADIGELDLTMQTAESALDQLARASGYKWYITHDKKLYFQETGTVTDAAHDLDETGAFQDYRNVSKREDLDQYRNRQIIIGQETEDGRIEYTKENLAEISARQAVEGGSGVYEHIISDDTIATVQAAEDLATSLLDLYGTVPIEINFDSYTVDWRPGTRLKVHMPSMGITSTRYFLIEQVDLRDLGGTLLGAVIRASSRDAMNFSTQMKEDYVAFFRQLLNSEKKAIARASEIDKISTSRMEDALLRFNEQLANALGFHITEVIQPDGKRIVYQHDQEALEDSQYIFFNPEAGVFAWTTTGWNDGNPAWDHGLDKDGNAILKTLTALGINADWLNAGKVKAQYLEIGPGTDFTAGYDPSDKRRVFTSQPTPPYDIGDLWVEGSSGDIKKCKTAKTAGGSYSAADWELASKYTDDTAVGNLSGSLKAMAFEDLVELAKLGTTILDGAYLKTSLIKIDGSTSFATGYNPATKRRVFTAQPVPPYDIGDLWAQGSTGDIRKCKTAKAEGASYSLSDWELASKYTDDTTVNTLAGNLKDLAYEDLVELAMLGDSIIAGGYIKTELLDATAINSQVVHISASTSFALGYDPSSKRRVFNSQPTPPYDVGDLWTGGSTGDLRRCKTARADGSYSAADWELASKYTDDTTVNALAGSLKDMAYEDIVELSMLGETIIVGGYLKTELLDATAINTQIIQIGSGTSFATGYDPSAKNRIFSSTPTTPYYVGDLWTQGSTGDIRRCKTARTSGSYQAADWEIASKYTDDTAVNSLSGSLKDMAFENTVELAKLGTTIIQGGYIKTDLIYIGSGSSYAVGYDPSKIPYVGANLLLKSGVPVTSNQYLIKSYTPVTPLIEGKQYIITVTLTPAAGVTALAPTASNGYHGLPNMAVTGTNKQTVSITFNMGYATGRKPSDNISNANVGIYRIPNDGSVTGNTTIHRIKIEEGNKATAWEAAAEDSVQQNVSYKGVVINENDGFVSAATIGGKTTLVKMNAIDGIGITHDGDKTFGVDTDGSTYVTKLKNPNDPTAYASIGRTAAAGGSIFTLYGTSGYGNPRRKLSIESYLRTAVHMEVPMPEQTGDGDYNGANMFALGNGPGAHLTLWGYVNAVIMQGGDNQHGNSYSTVTAGDNNVEMQFNNRVTSNNHTIGVDNTGPYYKISGVRKNIGDPVMSYGTPQTGWSNANGIQGFRSTDGVIYLSISLISGTITTNTLVGTIGANLRPKYPIVVECYDFEYELLNNYKLVVLTNGDIRIRGTSTFITGRRYEGACAYVAS